MANDKISWEKALRFYLTADREGKPVSYKNVAEEFCVSESQVEEHGRLEKWAEARERAREIAREKVIQKSAEELAQINQRHINIARMLQTKAIQAIEAK